MKNRFTGRLGRLFLNAVPLESRSPGSVVSSHAVPLESRSPGSVVTSHAVTLECRSPGSVFHKIRNTTDPGLKPSRMTLCDERRSGFTLIELLVVVLIIGILSAVALPMYKRAVANARAAEAITVGRSLVNAIKEAQLANPGSVTWDTLSVQRPDSKDWTYTFWGGPVVEASYKGPSLSKIPALKALRMLTSAGLKECKEYLEGTRLTLPADNKQASYSPSASRDVYYALYITEFGIWCGAANEKYMEFCKAFNKSHGY